MHLAWEYNAFRISGGSLIDGLNKVGADGWEALTIEHRPDHELVICKRCKTAISLSAPMMPPFAKAGRG